MKSKKRGSLAQYAKGGKTSYGSMEGSFNYNPYSNMSDTNTDLRSNMGFNIKGSDVINKDFPQLGLEANYTHKPYEQKTYPTTVYGQPKASPVWEKGGYGWGMSAGLTLGNQNINTEKVKKGFTTNESYLGAGIGLGENVVKPYVELHPEIGYNTGSKRSGMGYSPNQYIYGNLDIKGNPFNNDKNIRAIESGTYKANANLGYEGQIGKTGLSGFGEAGYNFLTKKPNATVGIKSNFKTGGPIGRLKKKK